MKKLPFVLAAVLCFLAAAFGQTSDELVQKANDAYQQKRFRQAAELYAKALEAGGDDAYIAYGAACSYVLAGVRDQAFAYLNKAADLGFSDPDQADKDKDFESLRGDPRWKAALARFTRNAKERVLMWDSPSIATASAGDLSDDLKVAG